ncbi:MAG TPA: DUF2259 domain-containing protein [Myxococcales bacterium]|jgi:predicted secreted protein
MSARSHTLVVAAAALLLLLPALAVAGDKDELEVVGFSDDAALFAYWTYGVYDGSGFPHAELNVVSTATGRKADAESKALTLEEAGEPKAALEKLKAAQAKHLEALKFGRDKGAEMYKSGTARATQFTVEGRTVEVKLDVRQGKVDEEKGTRDDSIGVRLVVGGKAQTVYQGRGGWDYGLNAVRLSANHKSVAVLVKHSAPGFEGFNRRYLCGAGRIAR